MTSPKKSLAKITRLESLPGHHIRRLHQIAVALFFQETEAWGVTPVQYAAMQAIFHSPKLDQRNLGRSIGFDSSTITGVLDRLEARGLITRSPSPEDRRAKLLELTLHGKTLLEEMMSSILHSQDRLLEPLNAKEQTEFKRMLKELVLANSEISRIPSKSI